MAIHRLRSSLIALLSIFTFALPISALAADTFIGIATAHGSQCRLVDNVTQKVAQAFTPSSAGTLEAIAFYQGSTDGSPANTVHVRLYSDSAGGPGTILATGSNVTWVNDGGWATSTISYTLVAGTQYWAEADNGGSGSGSDVLRIGAGTDSVTAYQQFTGSWGSSACGSQWLSTVVGYTMSTSTPVTPTSTPAYTGLNREEQLSIWGVVIFLLSIPTWSYFAIKTQ